MRRGRIWGAVGLLMALIATLGSGWRTWAEPSGEPLILCPPVAPVLLDPGHGGIDGGANRESILEKEIVLDIALRTEQHLLRQQVPVMLTRRADIDLGGKNDGGRLRRDINHRVRIANRCNAVFTLSIHVNSATDESEKGMMLFYQPSPWGRDAAFLLDGLLRPLHQRRELPHPRGDFAVLRWTKAPALLVELGFISHPEDRQRLTNAEYREEIAQALAAGCAALYQQWVDIGRR